MKYERDNVLRDLRKYVVEIFIPKSDGTAGLISFRSTLREDLLPKSYQEDKLLEMQFHEENKDSISSFNVANGKWVTLNVSDIKYVQVVEGY